MKRRKPLVLSVDDVVKMFSPRLPFDVSPEQFREMVTDALASGAGLTWIRRLFEHSEKCK